MYAWTMTASYMSGLVNFARFVEALCKSKAVEIDASQLAQLVYNFAEQLNWAAKIGLIRNKRRRRNIERWTSISELSTYVFTINVSLLTLWRCSRRESDARPRRRHHKSAHGVISWI